MRRFILCLLAFAMFAGGACTNKVYDRKLQRQALYFASKDSSFCPCNKIVMWAELPQKGGFFSYRCDTDSIINYNANTQDFTTCLPKKHAFRTTGLAKRLVWHKIR